jgi:D-alanine-D-alanine ligase
MVMISVMVLMGGSSDEREVSLRSGKAVSEALTNNDYQVTQLDPADEPSNELLKNADVIFPVLHGNGGEDGSLQAKLEQLSVTYVGSDSVSSRLCFDKWQYKELLITNDIPNPYGELVNSQTFWQSKLISNPFALKPRDGGSSIDNYICRDTSNLDKSIVNDIFSRHPEMLLEELVLGTEITLSILGEQALPVIEIIPPPSGEFDYDNKYNGQSQELCPPQNVAKDIQKQAQDLALRIHKLCNCRDFSRSDMMIDSAGNLFVLETNTIPGMTNQSLFPKAAQTAGISMEDLVDQLVKLALVRKTT